MAIYFTCIFSSDSLTLSKKKKKKRVIKLNRGSVERNTTTFSYDAHGVACGYIGVGVIVSFHPVPPP